MNIVNDIHVQKMSNVLRLYRETAVKIKWQSHAVLSCRHSVNFLIQGKQKCSAYIAWHSLFLVKAIQFLMHERERVWESKTEKEAIYIQCIRVKYACMFVHCKDLSLLLVLEGGETQSLFILQIRRVKGGSYCSKIKQWGSEKPSKWK